MKRGRKPLRGCCRSPKGKSPHEAGCVNYREDQGAGWIRTKFDLKQKGETVTLELLRHREQRARGYPTAKWIYFCRRMLDQGYSVALREAAMTFSKYITVSNDGREYLLRFSNHKPVKRGSDVRDCDLFVGITDDMVITTEQAIEATITYLGPSQTTARSQTQLHGETK